jgi:hypothetical protein
LPRFRGIAINHRTGSCAGAREHRNGFGGHLRC